MSNDRRFDVDSMGVMTPKPVEILELTAGEVGFFVATIKNVADTKVGDTITSVENPHRRSPLPGFEDIKSMVFADAYTVDSHEHEACSATTSKNFASTTPASPSEPESSVALGFGFRCPIPRPPPSSKSFRSASSAITPSTSHHNSARCSLQNVNPHRRICNSKLIIHPRWPDPSEIVSVEGSPSSLPRILTNE